MRALLLAMLVGCAPQAMTTNAQHPANPDAPTGRLAGPPAALRRGVADVSTPARGTSPASGQSGHGAAPQDPAQDHGGHQGHAAPDAEPANAEPANTAPAKTAPAKTEPKAPAQKPRTQDKRPASKKAPGTDTPKPPPPAHQGHEGHH